MNKLTKRFGQKMQSGFILIAFIVVLIVFSCLSETFRTMDNILIILRQVSILAVLGFGMTFVITAGHIDLSVGSTVALVSLVAAKTISANMGIGFAVVFALLTGLAVGLINGLIVSKLRIPAFLATLGMMSIIRGTALAWTKTMPVPLSNDTFGGIFNSAMIGGVPVIVFWMLGALAVCILLYNFTPVGNYVKAVGGNATAARFSGISVTKITILVFIISGLLAGLAGLMQLARMKTARPDTGADFAIDAVTAVILGGTSLYGGKGSIINTLIGALLLTTITNALVILGVDANIQQIIKGVIVILAVSIGNKND